MSDKTFDWHRSVFPSGADLQAAHVDDVATYVGGWDGLYTRPHGGAWSLVPMRGRSNFISHIHGSDGWVHAVTTSGAIHSSCDGGKWTSRKPGFGSKATVTGVAAFGGGRVLAVERNSTAAWSSDGGRNWEVFERGPAEVIDAICVAGQRVYAGAGTYRSGGKILFSADFGYTWDDLTIPELPSRSTVQALWASPRHVFAIFGCVLLRWEHGASSADVALTHSAPLVSAGGIDPLVFAAADDGSLLQSVDGGNTWQPGAQLSDDAVIFASHGQRLVAVGNDGMVSEYGVDADAGPSPTAAAAFVETRMGARTRLHEPTDLPLILQAAPAEPDSSAVNSVCWGDGVLYEARASGRLTSWKETEDGWLPCEMRAAGAEAFVAVAAQDQVLWGLCTESSMLMGVDERGRPVEQIPLEAPGLWLAVRGDQLFVATQTSVSVVGVSRKLEQLFATDIDSTFDVSLDGAQLMCGTDGGQTVAVFNRLGTPQGRFSRKGSSLHGGFSPDGKRLLLVDGDRYAVHEVNPVTMHSKRWIEGRQVGTHLVFGAAARAKVAVLDADGDIQVFDTATRAFVGGFHPDRGRSLGGAPRTPRGTERIFSRHRIVMPANTLAVSAVALTADGRHIAVGDIDGELCVADTSAAAIHHLGQRATVLQSPSSLISSGPFQTATAGIGPDGTPWVVGLDHDNVVTFVRLDDGESWTRPLHHAPSEISELSLQRDVLLIRTPDHTMAFDMDGGQPLWVNAIHIDRLHALGDGWLYGFEAKSSYVAGERVGHRLFRLELATGVFEEDTLPVPPGCEDNLGYLSDLTIVDGKLLVNVDRGDEICTWLWDRSNGTFSPVEHEVQSTAPVVHLSDFSGQPLGGGLVFFAADGGWAVQDVEQPNAPFIAQYSGPTPPQHGSVTRLTASIQGDRVIGFDAGFNSLHLWSLREAATIARLKGLGAHPIALALSTDGTTAVTAERDGPMRRWACP